MEEIQREGVHKYKVPNPEHDYLRSKEVDEEGHTGGVQIGMAHHQSVASETLFLLVLEQAPTIK